MNINSFPTSRMHAFVSTLKKEAQALNTSPTSIIREAGFSDANWYHWKAGRSNPSAEIQKKLKKTIEAMKKPPIEAPTVIPHAQVQAGEKTINQVLQEKKDAVALLQEQIEVLSTLSL